MQTPISFLLDLILDEELPPSAQKRCRKYIRELESNLSKSQSYMPGPATADAFKPIRHGAPQAPSTQKILDAMAAETGAAMVAAPLPPKIPAIQRIIGGEVNTGNGTKGPRKF